jgi:antirestriction protein ArdC
MTATATKTADKAQSSAELYQAVTDRFITAIKDAIKEGKATGNWRKPWTTPAMSHGPVNLISKKNYRGINYMMLALAPYESRFWLSEKQIADRKGTLKAGEKRNGWQVVFWQVIKNKRHNPQDPNSKPAFPILRAYTVYNLDQTENVRLPKWAVAEMEGVDEPVQGWNPIDDCDDLVKSYRDREKLMLVHGQTGAFYMPMLDRIGMPDQKHFHTDSGYYSTLFHEIGHSTGHKSRLNRPEVMTSDGFGGQVYSKEELVAEFTAALVCAVMGIENDSQVDNTEAYLRNWLKKLRDEPKLLVQAAGKAQKAADFILSAREDDAS